MTHATADFPCTGGFFRYALLVMAVFFGGLAFWSIVAPLATAARAPGIVRVEGQHRLVQHLEGGIVAALLARDGQLVAAGDALVQLDGTQLNAELVALQTTWNSLSAQEVRLLAELAEQDAIAWPPQLTANQNDTEMDVTLATQQRLFQARQRTMASRRAILQQKIAQLHAEKDGLQGQADATQRQRQIITNELTDTAKLYSQGLLRKQDYDEKRRLAALLDGNFVELHSKLTRNAEQITETELQLINLKDRLFAEIARELRSTQDERARVKQRINAAHDRHSRLRITAPISGRIQNLKLHTIGGVVAPGQTLMAIVPQDEPLIIEARANPIDIDIIRPGLLADIQLSAFQQRTVAPLRGQVLDVSPDRVEVPGQETGYYLVRIAIAPAELEKQTTPSLYPGMPAEVFIKTGEQSLFQYLASPVWDLLRRSFRET